MSSSETTDDADFAGSWPTTPTTSSIGVRAVQTSSGTASLFANRTTTEFTRKAGERGARDCGRSLVASLKHLLGIHDWVDICDHGWDHVWQPQRCWWCPMTRRDFRG